MWIRTRPAQLTFPGPCPLQHLSDWKQDFTGELPLVCSLGPCVCVCVMGCDDVCVCVMVCMCVCDEVCGVCAMRCVVCVR